MLLLLSSDMALCNLPGLVAACLPWRSATSAEAREFWVPDQSCRECYDCGSTFTFCNRRHHCRDCGRIFCRKCASNWIPAPSSGWNDLEERDMIRVCKQCFKHSERRLTRRDSVGAVGVEEQSGSISESILNFVFPNRERFVATSSLYAAGMNSEDSFKKKSKNDDAIIKPLDIQNFGLLWLPPEEANDDDNTQTLDFDF